MKKKDLRAESGISWASVIELSKVETVSIEVIKTFNCDMGDIMGFDLN